MATKKITELPLIQTISGSFSVVPIVIGNTAGNGTTDQITIENFSRFVTAYSAHTGSVGNTFAGPQTFNSSSTFNDNVTINGRLTVTEVVAQYETASVIFSSGSNIFGDKWDDVHTFTGSVIYNGVILTNIDANTIQRLQQTTASLNTFTSSQADRNLVLSTVTGSINQATASIQFQTASLLEFTASQDSRNFTLSQVTASFNYFYQATASLQTFTASQADRNLVLSIVTGSINQATASLQFQTASLLAFTASQDSRNLTLSTVTGSLIGITNGLMAFTAALDNTYATDAQLYQLYQSTRSLELHSGSMIGVTNGLMAYTASNSTLNTGLRGEVDGIEAYTASLKAQAIVSSSTQVQNYDVFALNSNLYTSTGSLIGITNGLMAFTAALDNTYATDAQLLPILQATRSLELLSGSLIGITNGLMAFTAALDNTYATDAQLYQLYQSTQSLELHSGSMVGVTNGLMNYTASLKGAAIVSSSQQVQNYFAFAVTSSNNSFFGENTFTYKVTHTNGYIVLSQVSASLNFVDDTAAAAGGVPLGGLYRNGNFIVIRIV